MTEQTPVSRHHYNPVEVELSNTVGAIFLGIISLLLLLLLVRQQNEIKRLNSRLTPPQ